MVPAPLHSLAGGMSPYTCVKSDHLHVPTSDKSIVIVGDVVIIEEPLAGLNVPIVGSVQSIENCRVSAVAVFPAISVL
ncbi:MAG: hypothetical protein BWY28_02330 [bacterium ADurb.Bin236]|nr:MAG: hypothetical protein BWY28_02330 [bacterium ADurb.Bin236]